MQHACQVRVQLGERVHQHHGAQVGRSVVRGKVHGDGAAVAVAQDVKRGGVVVHAELVRAVGAQKFQQPLQA